MRALQVSFVLLAAAVGVFWPGVAWADKGDGADERPPRIERAAREVLLAFAAGVEQLQSIEIRVEAEIAVTFGKQVIKGHLVNETRQLRPNLLYDATQMRGLTDEDKLLVCDGQTWWRFDRTQNQYTRAKAPATWAGLSLLSATSVERNAGLDPDDPVTQVLMSDAPRKAALKDVVAARQLGEEEIDGRACHHLELITDEMKWDVWLSVDQPPAPVRLVPDMSAFVKKMVEQNPPRPNMPEMKFSVTIDFKSWEPNAELTADDFKFAPPEDAEEVAVMYPGFKPERDPSQLVGKGGPTLALKSPAGDDLRVGPQADTVVLVLFWASWDEGSRQALPAAAAMAKKFKDRGLILQTVHLGDDAKAASKALDDLTVAVPVAMDNGQSAGAYRAYAVPQFVLIGREGTIEAVHLALPPDLEATLAGEIEALLAGKALAQ